MAKIDALLQHMIQNGANRAVLSADAPAILESAAGSRQGKPMASAQIEAMLDEILPADARQSLQTNGRANFIYSAPTGDFDLSATQTDGQWHLEITPAATTVPGDVATSQDATVAPIEIAPTTESQNVELAKKKGPPRFDPSATIAPPASPPASPPDAATPPQSGYPAPGGNAFNNDSGMGDASVLPAELRGFNWGALFGSWIWGLGNSVWLALLCLVPCVGFFVRFYLGAKGSEMAWKRKRWESVQAFKSAQVTWGVIGGLVTVGSLVFLVIPAAILFPVFARARENARRSSCSSNMKQISLAVLQFSQDHNETLPVGTTMAQWKPQLQPYLGGKSSDQLFICPSHQGAGESYEVNPALSGVALATIDSPWETPMFYEPKSDLHLDGSNIAFADGHIKWFREERVQDVLSGKGQ